MKVKYIKPEVELVEVAIEGVIAVSGPDNADISNDEYTGSSFSKGRNFWGED